MDLFNFLAGGVVARDRLFALGPVDGQQRRREAQRPNLHRLLRQRAHFREVFSSGCFAVGAVLT